MNLRKAILSDPARRADLAAIHVGKKALGMEDDAYRAMLWSIARVKSAGDLDFAGRRAVLDHLRKCGFTSARRAPGAQDPTSRKIRAQWLRLKGLGVLRNASERALEQYVERVTGVTKLQWLSSDQASTVIESLKQWERRVSVSKGAANG